jgi:hypothetical protein
LDCSLPGRTGRPEIDGWRTAQLTFGILVWMSLIPAAFLVRQAPRGTADRAPAGMPEAGPRTGVASALRSPQFVVLALTYFACCAAHSGPIFQP